jgi:hypothetical protein
MAATSSSHNHTHYIHTTYTLDLLILKDDGCDVIFAGTNCVEEFYKTCGHPAKTIAECHNCSSTLTPAWLEAHSCTSVEITRVELEELCIDIQAGEELCIDIQAGEELCIDIQAGEELCIDIQAGEELCIDIQAGERSSA